MGISTIVTKVTPPIQMTMLRMCIALAIVKSFIGLIQMAIGIYIIPPSVAKTDKTCLSYNQTIKLTIISNWL